METKRGWWELKVTGIDELKVSDKDNIADLIQQGFTSGEVVQEEEVIE